MVYTFVIVFMRLLTCSFFLTNWETRVYLSETSTPVNVDFTPVHVRLWYNGASFLYNSVLCNVLITEEKVVKCVRI